MYIKNQEKEDYSFRKQEVSTDSKQHEDRHRFRWCRQIPFLHPHIILPTPHTVLLMRRLSLRV